MDSSSSTKPRRRTRSPYKREKIESITTGEPPFHNDDSDIDRLAEEFEYDLQIHGGECKALEVCRCVDKEDGVMYKHNKGSKDDKPDGDELVLPNRLKSWFGGERRGTVSTVVQGRVWMVVFRTNADGTFFMAIWEFCEQRRMKFKTNQKVIVSFPYVLTAVRLFHVVRRAAREFNMRGLEIKTMDKACEQTRKAYQKHRKQGGAGLQTSDRVARRMILHALGRDRNTS